MIKRVVKMLESVSKATRTPAPRPKGLGGKAVSYGECSYCEGHCGPACGEGGSYGN